MALLSVRFAVVVHCCDTKILKLAMLLLVSVIISIEEILEKSINRQES